MKYHLLMCKQLLQRWFKSWCKQFCIEDKNERAPETLSLVIKPLHLILLLLGWQLMFFPKPQLLEPEDIVSSSFLLGDIKECSLEQLANANSATQQPKYRWGKTVSSATCGLFVSEEEKHMLHACWRPAIVWAGAGVKLFQPYRVICCFLTAAPGASSGVTCYILPKIWNLRTENFLSNH